uniref:Uncharacterized protein n=1 Tax=Arundo donax TaxID=35708 RepID=A0A0A8YXQ7_ARUDO
MFLRDLKKDLIYGLL